MAEKRLIEPRAYPWDPQYKQQPYSLAVERNGLLCVSGLTAEEYDERRGTYLIKSVSLVDQLTVIFEKLKVILETGGYTFQDVVFTVDYALQACLPEYRLSGEVRRKYFVDNMSAAVGILIEGIPDSAAIIVMDAVAMRGARNKKPVFPTGTPSWERYRTLTYWPGFFVDDHWFWLSGATGRAYDSKTGTESYPEGVEEQTRVTWTEKLGEVLRVAGVDPSTVVRNFDYIDPACLQDYPRTWDVRREVFKGNKIAGTSLVVHRMLGKEAMLEIDAICYLGADKEVITVPEWEVTWGKSALAPAVRCEKVLFCSAQGPIDHTSGKVIGVGNLEAQVHKTYENVARVLQAAGASLGDVVRTIEFTNPQNAYRQEVLDKARRASFISGLPAVTTVTANQLLPPEAGFGMEVWAVLE